MKEFESRPASPKPSQGGLTNQPPHPRLEVRGDSMADETGGENASPADDAPKGPEISDEVLAQRWGGKSTVPWEQLTSEQKEIFKQNQASEGSRTGAERSRDVLPMRREIEGIIRDLRTGKLNKAQKEALFHRFQDIRPPSGLSSTDKETFEHEKQMIASRVGSEMLEADMGEGSTSQQELLIRRIQELRSAVRGGDFDAIDEIIGEKLDNNRSEYALAISHVVNTLQGTEGGRYDYMLEYMLEYGVERILSMADIQPKSPYPRFNLYEEMNLDGVIQTARIYDEKAAKMRGNPRPDYRVFRYLANLRTKRNAMHELFRGMKNRKTYVDLVTELLRKDGMAFVEKEIAGVADLQVIYEQVLGSKLAFAKEGWLNGDDFEKADNEAEETLRYSMRENPENYQKRFVKRVEADGTPVFGSRNLRRWELDRAMRVGRSMGAASQRRLVYGILGDLPKRDPRSIKSIEFEFMARILGVFKLIPWRFFYQPIARRFLDRMIQELKRKGDGTIDHFKYGYMKDGNEKGLYGKSQYALAIVDTGVTDPKSNGWRNRNLFLEQEDFKTKKFEGEFYGIGQYLDELKLQIEKELKEQAKRAGDLKGEDWEIENQWEVFLKTSERHPYKARLKQMFNDRVRKDIKDERLFLGTLMRHYDLDDANKHAIWENVAELLPSRMAAFFPEEALGKIGEIYGTDKEGSEKKWNEFKMKLWLIERARVKEDAKILKKGGQPRKSLSDYYQGEGAVIRFDAKEIALVKALQKIGKDHVVTDEKGNPTTVEPGKDAKGGLVRMKFPFTAFLDDVPKTDWERLEDEDYDRILVNDHSNYQEGHKELVSLIAFPGLRPDVVAEHFKKALDNIEQPLGRSETQKYMEVYLNTYLPMARQTRDASWLGWVMKNLYIPRSEMEKYNIASEIAQDEKDQEQIIQSCAKGEVINADTTKADKDGMTQYLRILKRNYADRLSQFKRWLRILAQLLGPVAAKEFLKIILPGNLAKDLGL